MSGYHLPGAYNAAVASAWAKQRAANSKFRTSGPLLEVHAMSPLHQVAQGLMFQAASSFHTHYHPGSCGMRVYDIDGFDESDAATSSPSGVRQPMSRSSGSGWQDDGAVSSSVSTSDEARARRRLWESQAWHKVASLLTMYEDQRNEIPRSWGTSIADPVIRAVVWSRIRDWLLVGDVTATLDLRGVFAAASTAAASTQRETGMNVPLGMTGYDGARDSLASPGVDSPYHSSSVAGSPRTPTAPASVLHGTSPPRRVAVYHRLPSLPPTVTRIDLSDNMIGSLPADLHLRLPNLTHLNLAGNGLIQLPPDWQSSLDTCMPSLVSLNVSRNQLTELPLFWPASLQALDYSHNRIPALPAALPVSLQELNMSGNTVATDWFENDVVPAKPFHLMFPALRVLDISWTRIQPLPEILPPTLEVLGCEGVGLTSLPAVITTLSNLRSLNCAHNMLLHLPQLPESVKHLDVRGNVIDPHWLRDRNIIPALPFLMAAKSSVVVDDGIGDVRGLGYVGWPATSAHPLLQLQSSTAGDGRASVNDPCYDETWRVAAWNKLQALIQVEIRDARGARARQKPAAPAVIDATVSTGAAPSASPQLAGQQASAASPDADFPAPVLSPPASWRCPAFSSTGRTDGAGSVRLAVWRRLAAWLAAGDDSAAFNLALIFKAVNVQGSDSVLSGLPDLPPTLQHLDVSNCGLAADSMPIDLNSAFPNLRVLIFADNPRLGQFLPSKLPYTLEVLDVSRCGITGVLPPSWTINAEMGEPACTMPHLRVLKMSGNAIAALPTAWPETLRVLHCDGNKLQAVPESMPRSLTELRIDHNTDFKLLPDELSNSTGTGRRRFADHFACLRILSVSGCSSLSALPDSLPPSLEELLCDGCCLSQLPEHIGDCASLRTLDCSSNKHESVADSGITYFPKSISNCTSLERLLCSSNRLASFPTSLSSLPRLLHVNFSRSNIFQLPSDLPDSLTTLNLEANPLTLCPPRLPTSLVHLSVDVKVLLGWMGPAARDGVTDVLKAVLLGLAIVQRAPTTMHAAASSASAPETADHQPDNIPSIADSDLIPNPAAMLADPALSVSVQQALQAACTAGRFASVALLLKAGAAPDVVVADDDVGAQLANNLASATPSAAATAGSLPPLHRAVMGGHLDIARILLEHAAASDSDSQPGNRSSSQRGQEPGLDLPVADTAQGSDGSAVAGVSNPGVGRGAARAARMVLAPCPAARDGMSALHLAIAAEKQSNKMLDMLLEYCVQSSGAPSQAEPSRDEPQLQASSTSSPPVAAEFSISTPVPGGQYAGCTPLHIAIATGFQHAWRSILALGGPAVVDVNLRDAHGRSPLWYACMGVDDMFFSEPVQNMPAVPAAANPSNAFSSIVCSGGGSAFRTIAGNTAANSSKTQRRKSSTSPPTTAADACISALLAAGADVNAIPSSTTVALAGVDSPSILHVASASGRGSALSALLPGLAARESGCTSLVDHFQTGATTIMHLAAAAGHSATVAAIIGFCASNPTITAAIQKAMADAHGNAEDDNNANKTSSSSYVDVVDGSLRTPLHCAVHSGSAPTVQALLSAGADVNAQESTGKSPLHLAAANGNVQIAAILLKSGARALMHDFEHVTPLRLAHACGASARAGGGGSSASVIMQQVGSTRNLNHLSTASRSTMTGSTGGSVKVSLAHQAAAQHASQALVFMMLESVLDELTAPTSSTDHDANDVASDVAEAGTQAAGATTGALEAGLVPAVDAVEQAPVELQQQDQQNKHSGMVRMEAALRDAGADVSITSHETGASLIHAAAAKGSIAALQCLLKVAGPGAAALDLITAFDRHGLSPLHHAAAGGHLAMVEHLLSLGATPVRDRNPISRQLRQSVVSMALAGKHVSIIVVLLDWVMKRLPGRAVTVTAASAAADHDAATAATADSHGRGSRSVSPRQGLELAAPAPATIDATAPPAVAPPDAAAPVVAASSTSRRTPSPRPVLALQDADAAAGSLHGRGESPPLSISPSGAAAIVATNSVAISPVSAATFVQMHMTKDDIAGIRDLLASVSSKAQASKPLTGPTAAIPSSTVDGAGGSNGRAQLHPAAEAVDWVSQLRSLVHLPGFARLERLLQVEGDRE